MLHIEKIKLPRVIMEVTCSKGTYIRTLCHDIGRKLGCGACMEQLTRTRVAGFKLEDSLTIDRIETLAKEDRLSEILIPVDALFLKYPAVFVTEEWQKALENGNRIPVPGMREWKKEWEPEPVRIYDCLGRFAGIYQYQPSAGDVKPVKIFLEKD